MAFNLADRVRETASAPGTGTVTLLGAVTGYQTFSAGIGANNTTYYVIADQSGNNWEVGLGTIGSGGTTLARTTVLSSSNSGSLVNFTSGTQDVFCDYTATKAIIADINGNITANALDDAYTNTAASGTAITLTAASPRRYTITGSGGQVIKLPDATTLTNGTVFQFDNNQSSGAITVNNNSNTLIVSVPSGGFVLVNLLSNAIAAGSWDRHDQAPSNVSWSTNTFDYAGSITSATWNGNTVQVNRGGTGAATLTGLVVGNGTSAMTTVTAPSGTVVGTTDTQTLTNKRINPRISSTTSTATLTVNSDFFDQAVLTAQAVALSVAAPTGTPVNGQKLTLRFKDNATAQTISWTTTSGGFRVIGCTLPTTTVISKVVYIGCIYNSDETFWDVVSVGQQI